MLTSVKEKLVREAMNTNRSTRHHQNRSRRKKWDRDESKAKDKMKQKEEMEKNMMKENVNEK